MPVAADQPVVIGQWHSNLAAAKAKAQELGVPLLVIFSLNGCSICANFDKELDSQAALDYFASRGLIMVYEKASNRTAISDWAGPGESNVPFVRITWWAGSTADYHWVRPGSFSNFRSVIESKIGGYVYNPTPPDTSKDKYDTDSDSSATAPTLAWSDQEKSEQLKLAKKTSDPAYTDLADWYKLAVVTGATYAVEFSGVGGITTDDPQVALYSDAAGTQVVGGQEDLANGVSYEYEPEASGDLYIKVWRTASADTNIVYTLAYQRFAPGTIQFGQPAVSVAESAASVSLTVKRVGGTTGAASVQIGFEDSLTPDTAYTATSGQDFNGAPSPATLTWADGDAADKTVTFALIKNVTEWEGAETFGVTLSPVGETAVGADAVVTLLEVDALTTRAATYYGWVSEGSEIVKAIDVSPEDARRVTGTITLSVSTAGKITGKAVFPKYAGFYSGSYTVQNASHQSISDGVAVIAGELVQISTRIPFTINVSTEDGQVFGQMGSGENVRDLELYRDDWATAEGQQLLAPYIGYYTAAFPVYGSEWPAEGAPTGSGYATITLDSRGKFKVGGKLGDGTTFSQSGVLVAKPAIGKVEPSVCAMLFTIPMNYKGGAFSGLLTFGDSDGDSKKDIVGSAEFPMVWVNQNPNSVGLYSTSQPGFKVIAGAVGGWYNKTENLQTFYAGQRLYVGDLEAPLGMPYTLSTRTPAGTARTAETAACASWEAAANLEVTPKADGTGFTVPAGDLAQTGTGADGMPLYNYGTAVNPNKLRMTFVRTTGVMSGAFSIYYDYATAIDTVVDPDKYTWRHSFKTVYYAGVLLQEQNNYGNGVTAYGYYQSPGTGTGAARSYSYKQSSEFRVHAVPVVETKQ